MAKITEKAFIRQIVGSIAIVVGCMFCLTFSSWAMFSDSVTETKQTLMAANFSVTTQIINKADSTVISPTHKNTFVLNEGSYTVTLTAKGTATETSGYAVMRFDDKSLFTPQLLPAGQGEVATVSEQTVPAAVTFALEITGAPKVITFESVWGTSAAGAQGLDTLIGDTVLIDTPVIEENAQSEEPEESTDTQSTVPEEESEASSQVSEDTVSQIEDETSSSEESTQTTTSQE